MSQHVTTALSPRTGVTRRAVVGAAAWSMPVIALSATAPALAASGGTSTPTLRFDRPFYAVVATRNVPEVTVILTTDGATGDPATPVTVTLPPPASPGRTAPPPPARSPPTPRGGSP